jgi:Zn-dependent protease
MNARFDWCVGIGRWMGVPVRLHVLLFLAVATVFAVDWHYRDYNPVLGTGLVTALLLIFSLVLHELAHVWTCINLGGEVHSMTLVPWGGDSRLELPEGPAQRLLVQLAGPFANGVMFSVGACLLIGAGDASLQQLVNPFRPRPFLLDSWESSLIAIGTWLNFQLMLVNLVPCFPLDGGRILREVFAATSPHSGGPKIEATLMAIGQLTGASLLVMAIVMRDFNQGPVQPIWALLAMAGISLLFAARFEYRKRLRELFQNEPWPDEDGPAGNDSDLAFDESSDSFFKADQYSQWLAEKQHQLEQTSATDVATGLSDAELTDLLLDKLHRDGIESLTRQERQALDRISQQLRSRRGDGSSS